MFLSLKRRISSSPVLEDFLLSQKIGRGSCQYNHGCTDTTPRLCSLISWLHWRRWRHPVAHYVCPSSMHGTLHTYIIITLLSMSTELGYMKKCILWMWLIAKDDELSVQGCSWKRGNSTKSPKILILGTFVAQVRFFGDEIILFCIKNR